MFLRWWLTSWTASYPTGLLPTWKTDITVIFLINFPEFLKLLLQLSFFYLFLWTPVRRVSWFKDTLNEILTLLKGNTPSLALIHKDLTKVPKPPGVYYTFINPAKFQNEVCTCYFQFVTSDFRFQINPSSFLCVIHATEAWDVYYALLMNIHITSCGYKNGSDSYEKLIIWLRCKHRAKWKLRLQCLTVGKTFRLQLHVFQLNNMADFHLTIHFVDSK